MSGMSSHTSMAIGWIIVDIFIDKKSALHLPCGHPLPKGRGRSYLCLRKALLLILIEKRNFPPSPLGERVSQSDG